MPVIIQYLIKLSVSLAIVYIFYRFILRPLTFYTWNRWYLLGYSAIAFIIPFVDINPMLSSISAEQIDVIKFIPVIDSGSLKNQNWFNLNDRWDWILVCFLAGVFIMLIRLSIQLVSYLKLKNSSKLLSADPVKLYQVDKDIVPFSFGNSIFINKEQHRETEMQEIIHHEFIHVKQKHTADMIWAEILCILNWYNPFAWLIKKVIRQNLEFIADQKVLQNGLDKKQYQYLLLKVAGGASFRIANQFNFSFLKKRIAMMNKMKSARFHLIKFLFVLPLIAVMLLSFRERIGALIELKPATVNPIVSSSTANQILKINIGNDTIPDKKASDTARSGKLGITIAPKDGEGQIKNDLLTDNPLFIVDEVIRNKDFVMLLSPDDIASMQVLKGESAEQYGEKGKNGVVRIYLKKPGETARAGKRSVTISLSDDKKVKLRNNQDSTIMIADSIVYNLDQDNITVKDSVRIDASQRSHKDRVVAVRSYGFSRLNNEPVYVINGIRQPKGANINKVDPNTIESISILKDAKAVEQYGSEAANGVILINTNNNAKGKNSIHRDTIRLQLKPGQNH